MCEAEEREIFQNAVDRRLSGLQENPFLAQRIMNAEKGEIRVKKKLTVSMVLVIVLLLIAVTALAVALLSPKEIVEQVAVPVAQNNDHENYTYEELAELIRTLNENGITLDEGSRMMKAFQAGHGYWEGDTIHEICRAAFGEKPWTVEQMHWYGEIMVATGTWTHNAYLLPEGDDLMEEEARKLAVKALKDTYDVELPAESNEEWQVGCVFATDWNYDEEGNASSLVLWRITFGPADKPNIWNYWVEFDRHGENIQTDHYEEKELDERGRQMYENIQAGYSKISEAVAKYGEVEHFWPEEIKQEIYSGVLGEPYAVPEQADYELALEDAKGFIAEKYGSDALNDLGDYQVGVIYQQLDMVEYDLSIRMWDFLLTTDPEYLSDGYRVQFNRVIHQNTGEEEITELSVEHAHLGSG